MTQRSYYVKHNEEKTLIFMGWDRPLQAFFMVIEKPSDKDKPFWSNLDNTSEPFPKNLDTFLHVLKEHNIKIPDDMIVGLLEDKSLNLGNKEVRHY